ncbi:unnamed protein product [Paramecium sonneborni]|uniref:Uncharacterized protein n=1 Tax=Paramecium sonneborni TaxID=65129 RepID=A0A8S1RBY2_9CILI|nr:unnamed protein product [Paramecium sonneborni]
MADQISKDACYCTESPQYLNTNNKLNFINHQQTISHFDALNTNANDQLTEKNIHNHIKRIFNKLIKQLHSHILSNQEKFPHQFQEQQHLQLQKKIKFLSSNQILNKCNLFWLQIQKQKRGILNQSFQNPIC